MTKSYGNINKLKERIRGEQTLPQSPTVNIKALEDENRFVEESVEETANLFSFEDKAEKPLDITTEMLEETHFIINKITNEIYERDPKQINYVTKVAEYRGINPSILLKDKCFYVTSPEYIETLFSDLPLFKDHLQISTSSNTLWKTRFLIPIRDFYGKVYGFVGWDKFSNAKYVEYSAELYKKSTLKVLGLPNVKDIIESNYIILTEGSFDYYRGIQNGLSIIANLGVSFNKRLKPLLNKVDIVFTAYDSDKTGIKNMNTIDSLHPNVYHIIFQDIQKINEDGSTYTSKGDLDEVLKIPENVKKLKREIKLRINNPYLKLKDIYI